MSPEETKQIPDESYQNTDLDIGIIKQYVWLEGCG
jgi:hypothetical protein